ncbi:MAG TPA: hypothetical protein VJ652_12790 [Noviherbaspirillum sp.]|nr:hypothetical protein [Noviherbaspirillum sp.]
MKGIDWPHINGGITVNTPVNTQSADTRLREYEQAERLAQEHLAKFDDMDYNVFPNQDWARLHESHAENVVVRWPDGWKMQPRDVAPVAVFLASDEAHMVAGATYDVTAGDSAHYTA